MKGVIQSLLNIEVENYWRLYEVWAIVPIKTINGSLLVGLHVLNSEFDVINTSVLFLNYSYRVKDQFRIAASLPINGDQYLKNFGFDFSDELIAEFTYLLNVTDKFSLQFDAKFMANPNPKNKLRVRTFRWIKVNNQFLVGYKTRIYTLTYSLFINFMIIHFFYIL